ncbi:PRC-barrel domain containing protein [Thermophilibacter mediterraneus]|uniref:PRC-barrel domain-containing protein n=1 Tax=Thermophilibacter mediterraneus TaxID=1871031 RepID=UPI003208F134
MARISDLTGLRVLVLKKSKAAKDGTVTEKYQRLGKVHNAVFSPDGCRVVGLMVKRPDAVGMIKREDAFLALDSYRRFDEKNLLVTRPEDGLDVAAQRRLGLNWDACIIWSGMDARTTDGTSLGYVSDAEFEEESGRVERFLTTDGSVARALIGSFVITPEMVRGYRDGFMVVDSGGRAVGLDGGIAGAAGEGYARAKAMGAKVGKKVGAAAGEAVDRGSFALGRALGKAKRAISDASAPEQAPQPPSIEAADVRVSRPVEGLPERSALTPEREEPRTYAPAAEAAPRQDAPRAGQRVASKQKASSGASRSTGDKVARAAGRQLSSFGKMFGSFKDEFDKASKG